MAPSRSRPPKGWDFDQLDRKARAEAGECVVANMRAGTDVALIEWAKDVGKFARIDRKTEWGNPYEIPRDGDRGTVVSKFAEQFLPHEAALVSRLPMLHGKVLGCWCHPKACHGDIIAELVNRQADGAIGP